MNMRSAFLIVFLAFPGSALSETGFQRETLATNSPEQHSATQIRLVAASDPIEQLGDALKGIFRNIFGTGTTPSPTKQQTTTDSPASTSSTETGAQGAASQANTERVLLRQYPLLSQMDPANYSDATFAEKIDTALTGEAQPVKNLACAATVYTMLARGRGDQSATVDQFYKIGDGAIAPQYVGEKQPFEGTRVLDALKQQRPVVLVGEGGPLGSHYVLAVGFERTAERTVITALDPWPSTGTSTGTTISIDLNTRKHPRWDVTFNVMRLADRTDIASTASPDSSDLLRRVEGRWLGKTSEGLTFEWLIDANGRYQTTFQRSGRPYRGGGTIWADSTGEIQWKADGLKSQSGKLVLVEEETRPPVLRGTIIGTQISFELERVAGPSAGPVAIAPQSDQRPAQPASPTAARHASSAAPKKNDIRGVTIGMTPEELTAKYQNCVEWNPTADPLEVKRFRCDVDHYDDKVPKRQFGRIELYGDRPGAFVTFTSVLTGRRACEILYAFGSSKSEAELVNEIVRQYGLHGIQPERGDPFILQVSKTTSWRIQPDVQLQFTYTPPALGAHRLKLANPALCDADKRAIQAKRAEQEYRRRRAEPLPKF